MTPAVSAEVQRLKLCVAQESISCDLIGHIRINGQSAPDFDVAQKVLSYWQQFVGKQRTTIRSDILITLSPQDPSMYKPAFAVIALDELLFADAQAHGELASEAEVRSKAAASRTDITGTHDYNAARDAITIKDRRDVIGGPVDENNPASVHQRTAALRAWLASALQNNSVTVDMAGITAADLPAYLADGL